MTYTRAQLQYRLFIAAGALLFSGALISTFFSTLVGKAPSFFSQTRLLLVWPLGAAAVYLGLLWMLGII
ncbi:hypothetical protein K5F93_19180 [Pseudomonas protegens]|uniref:hypothetical protein n=1 Tax=Pseudomonas protegens TaxID=380021 RepID=UPI001C8D043D|nr:hypothetical protein [Pseudomonas protegens]QZI68526.1 hypothetical protein K5F93_19180 [Pseudomonas protegens]